MVIMLSNPDWSFTKANLAGPGIMKTRASEKG